MSFSVTVNFILWLVSTYTSQCLVVWFKMVSVFAFHILFRTFEERGCSLASFMFENEAVTLPFLLF